MNIRCPGGYTVPKIDTEISSDFEKFYIVTQLKLHSLQRINSLNIHRYNVYLKL
jgi:hypothetical protein